MSQKMPRKNSEGYQRALQESGLYHIMKNLLLKVTIRMTQGLKRLKNWPEAAERPTAILVGADEMALGVVHGAEDKGYKIPTDFEVITSDNTRLSLMVRPQLTTVVQPLYDIGAVAMKATNKINE